jgi:hypothetical protein
VYFGVVPSVFLALILAALLAPLVGRSRRAACHPPRRRFSCWAQHHLSEAFDRLRQWSVSVPGASSSRTRCRP